MSEIRRRKVKNEEVTKQVKEEAKVSVITDTTNKEEALEAGTFWLTRIVLLRFFAFIYFVAFLVALNQNIPLIGKSGLLPVPLFLDRVKKHVGGSKADAAKLIPTIFWLFDYHVHTDILLNAIAASGLLLSAVVCITGAANAIIMFSLWLLYHSLVNVGQRWYSFGWESQMLESGFLAIFLCPLFSMRQMPQRTPTSFVIIMAFRWLIFRIMIGAGLIKIRGDQCWRDLTCMNYHYQTQPVPNPMAYFMHQEPEAMHKFETLANHFVELVVPWSLLLSRSLTMMGGGLQIFFQVVIIISGNLSFLNWLTILPSLACFDDKAYRWLFSEKMQKAAIAAEAASKLSKKTWDRRARQACNLSLGLFLLLLSVPVVQNLVSTRQKMNFAFSSLRIVNTYGAFGSVTKERTEIILQGTTELNPNSPETKWKDYEFNCKPGCVTRRPCLISPYHYRLDWLMWFAAFQDYQHNEWLVHLIAKLLANDEGATSLIAHNPFQDGPPPLWIRAQHYSYNFSAIGTPEAKEGQWWTRRLIGSYLPPVNLRSLAEYLKQFGWPVPRPK